MNSASILQWNINGVRNKKDELSELISHYKANIVALQDTKLWNKSTLIYHNIMKFVKTVTITEGHMEGSAFTFIPLSHSAVQT